MRPFFYLLFLSLVNPLLAQDHPTCDGLRYRTDVFTDVTVTEGLQFGSNTTVAGNPQDLFLDIYEPFGDNASSRPTIVLAFGGSFIGGNRGDLSGLCEAYARKGFVAVSIDYRLYDRLLVPLPTAEQMTDVVIKTIGDMKAAIRFLREDADTDNTYRIDSDLIFVGGVSAGSITAAHTAVLDSTDNIPMDLRQIVADNGGFRGNSSDNYQYTSEVAGFINFSGALSDANFIDENDPPFYSVHEEFDGTVPYGKDFARIFGFDIIYVEGSQVMNHVADSVGVINELNTIFGSSEHVGYLTGPNEMADVILSESATFVHDIFCTPIMTDVNELALTGVSVYPNPSQGLVFISNEQGLDLSLQLYNAVGQQLGTWKNVTEVDLGNFGAGAYFMEIKDEGTGGRLLEKVFVQ